MASLTPTRTPNTANRDSTPNTPVPAADWRDPVRMKLERKFRAGPEIPKHEKTNMDDVKSKQIGFTPDEDTLWKEVCASDQFDAILGIP